MFFPHLLALFIICYRGNLIKKVRYSIIYHGRNPFLPNLEYRFEIGSLEPCACFLKYFFVFKYIKIIYFFIF